MTTATTARARLDASTETRDEAVQQGGPGLDSLLLDGRAVDTQVAEAVTAAEVVETIEGASTLTVTLLDPDDVILRSPLLERAVDADVMIGPDELHFRLVRIASRPPMLTLTFEDRQVAHLRRHKRPRKASRAKVTRAEFIHALVREVKADPIEFFAPEEHKKQKVQRPEKDEARRSRSGQTGFASSSGVTVKGKEASRGQLRVLDDVLAEGTEQGATRRVLIGAVMCVTQESTAQNLRGGDRDSVGAFQQRASMGWPASRNVRKDAAEFFKRAIPVFKANPRRSIGWCVDQVQRSYTFGTARQGADYDKWRTEAETTVDRWLGGARAAGGGGTAYKQYQFRRGEPGKRENSWQAIRRMADEVRWRAFMRRGVLWYVSDPWLHEQPPTLVYHRGSDGVQRIEFEMDVGKELETATATLLATAGDVLPGDVHALRRLGEASGRYLVGTVRRSLFSPLVTVELQRPVKPLREPRPEQRSRSGGASGDALGDLDPRGSWGGTKSVFDDFIHPFMKRRGLEPGSQKEQRPSNPQSDHDVDNRESYATDYPTYSGERAARELARAFGWTTWKPNSYAVKDVTIGNRQFRVQILWGAEIDHADHVHVGLKRLGGAPPSGRRGDGPAREEGSPRGIGWRE